MRHKSIPAVTLHMYQCHVDYYPLSKYWNKI